MIIATSGKSGSGKDTVGKIIQLLCYNSKLEGITIKQIFKNNPTDTYFKNYIAGTSVEKWKIKKFADTLKDIVCLLIGCSREDLENQEFKETPLGEEWDKWGLIRKNGHRIVRVYSTFHKATKELENTWKGEGKITCIRMTPRRLLQLLGTEFGTEIIHPNIWINSLFDDYEVKLSNGWVPTYNNPDNSNLEPSAEPELPNWIITDLRFPNEIEAIKEKKGITIRINRPYYISPYKERFKNEKGEVFEKETKVIEHYSETALDNYKEFNYTIENNGTIEKLVEKVRTILQIEKII